MEKRTIRELLIILRDHTEKKGYINSGLCWEIKMLRKSFEITLEESEDLHNYIWSHRPKRGQYYVKTIEDSAWYWSRGLVRVRLGWLNYRIGTIKK